MLFRVFLRAFRAAIARHAAALAGSLCVFPAPPAILVQCASHAYRNHVRARHEIALARLALARKVERPPSLALGVHWEGNVRDAQLSALWDVHQRAVLVDAIRGAIAVYNVWPAVVAKVRRGAE